MFQFGLILFVLREDWHKIQLAQPGNVGRVDLAKPASKVGNWVQAGMVSLGTGINTWAGGDNKSTFGLGGHLGGCTVTLDGRTIIEKGEWKS